MWNAERRFSESRDYGEKFNYDPQWKGPLELEREKSEFGFFIVLVIYFTVWLGNGIYAICTGDMKAIYKDFHLDYLYPVYSDAIYIALGFTILGICLSLMFILLLRYFPRATFFTSIFAHLVSLAVIIGIIVHEAIQDSPEIGPTLVGVAISICAFLTAPVAICLFIFRRKIYIACGVIKESTKAVLFFPSSFLFPILPSILYILTIAFALCTWVCLYENSSTQNGDRPIHLYVLHGINLFGFYWMMYFIYAFSQMVLAGTFATWYWTADRNQIPKHVILKFMHITIRFHLGTLAFGSLIIAIIQTIRYLLRSGMRRSVERNDYFSAVCFSCFECICGVTEAAVEFINTNAYIMCTMHGNNLVESAKSVFNIFGRNYMKFWAVDCVTSTVLSIGGFLVVHITVLVTYAFCRMFTGSIVMFAAMIFVFVTTSLVSIAIFSVVEIAIETVFLCVLEDDERNNGSRQRPYFMTPELRQLLMRDQLRVVESS